jgi:Fe-S-cluster-containing hydrogenase component 2
MCPIGAIDGLVNKLGAKFGSTHHIRVDKQRCTGCNVCARNCMCGAIKMVDKIAIVDQVSCMSCHECVDVCDWNAIEWTTASRNKKPKRIKKGVEIFPEPNWQVNVLAPQTPSFSTKEVHWGRVVNGLIIIGFSLAVAVAALIY